MAKSYIPQFELGSGAFGRAVVVKHKESSKVYVAKIIQVKNLSEIELDRCVTEVLVMGSCNHRNIIQYVEAFVDRACLNIIMQYAKGGDLHEKIKNQKGVYFSREVILDWFIQIVLALEYIHSKGILHRGKDLVRSCISVDIPCDINVIFCKRLKQKTRRFRSFEGYLKPQNVFLTKDGTVKLGDFGIAKILSHGDDLASTRIGTPFYISPEICAGKQYNSSSDMWAAGCLLFELTLLRVPFNAASLSALTKNIIQCQFDHIPRHFGRTIPALISQLIVFEPEQRFTASQVLQHPELQELIQAHRKYNDDLEKVTRSRSKSRSENDRKDNQKVNCDNVLREKTIVSTDGKINKENNISKDKVGHVGGIGFDVELEVLKTASGEINKENERSKDKTGDIYETRSAAEHEVINNHCEQQNLSETVRVDSREELVVKKPVKGVDCVMKECPEPIKTSSANVLDRVETRSRSYSLKESVVRKLSAASPKLAETVRLQRLSISENKQKQNGSAQEGNGDAFDHYTDDVFSPEMPNKDVDHGGRKYGGGPTYTVLRPYNAANGLKKNDENNNSSSVTADINSALILALSMSMSNTALARSILTDKLAYSLGQGRSEALLTAVKQLVVEEGQGYTALKDVLREGEELYIPLVSTILCL